MVKKISGKAGRTYIVMTAVKGMSSFNFIPSGIEVLFAIVFRGNKT